MGTLNKDKGRTRCSQGAPNQGAGERLAFRLQCNRAEHVRGGKAEAQGDSIERSERKRAGTLSEQHKTQVYLFRQCQVREPIGQLSRRTPLKTNHLNKQNRVYNTGTENMSLKKKLHMQDLSWICVLQCLLC